MSSGAGGAVVGVVVVGVVAGAAVVAAGLVVGAGYCAVGIARGAMAVGRAANEAWEEHEQARALQARALALERRRIAEYLEVLRTYQDACSGAGIDPGSLVPGPYPAPSAPVAEIQDAIAAMEAATGLLHRRAQTRSAVERARALANALAHEATSDTRSAADSLDAEQSRRTAEQGERAAARARVAAEAAAHRAQERDASERLRISRALSELPEDADGQTLAEVQTWLDRLPSSSGDRLAQAAAELEIVCGRARSAAALRSAHERIAQGVIAALAGCGTPAAHELMARARGFLSGEVPWDPLLQARAKAELDRIQAEFDDMVAASVLATALTEQGYRVDPDSVVDMLSGGTFATRDEWPDHAVHVRLDGDRDVLDIEVVRQGVPGQMPTSVQREDDERIEAEFCTQLNPLLGTVAERGVTIRLDRRVEPGQRTLDRADFRHEQAQHRKEDRGRRGHSEARAMEANPDD